MPTKKKRPLTKADLKKMADQILDPQMYFQKGYHQFIRGKDLSIYTLVYGMDIDFIERKGFLGIGRKTTKKTLLSRPIRNGIFDVWVYFRPDRKKIQEAEESQYYEDQAWRDE